MRQSQLFGKTLREPPKDEQSVNAKLLVQAGYIDKLMAGVYSYLPLGLRVLSRIQQIIREEMNAIGGQELLLPALHPKENWEQTGRWTGLPDLYKLTDTSGRDFALGPTHEEVITPLVRRDVASYRDLPLSVYQFQTKFRMELRAKSGLLRGREFLMKDLYSFHATEDDLDAYYKKALVAYQKIFRRLGLGEATVRTFASGGTFSKYSHEFQTITPAGEDTVYLCPDCRVAINEEIIDEQPSCPECGRKRERLEPQRAIEVGNTFQLKTKYSDPFKLTFKDEQGVDRPVLMCCYGIGLGRLMGAIVEVHHDEQGITWPVVASGEKETITGIDYVAPYYTHLLCLGNEPEVKKQAEETYAQLIKEDSQQVLYDDRDVSSGVKLKDADLIGLPQRIVVSQKMVREGKLEVKMRRESRARFLGIEEVLKL